VSEVDDLHDPENDQPATGYDEKDRRRRHRIQEQVGHHATHA
jgi:hypothetical protein